MQQNISWNIIYLQDYLLLRHGYVFSHFGGISKLKFDSRLFSNVGYDVLNYFINVSLSGKVLFHAFKNRFCISCICVISVDFPRGLRDEDSWQVLLRKCQLSSRNSTVKLNAMSTLCQK